MSVSGPAHRPRESDSWLLATATLSTLPQGLRLRRNMTTLTTPSVQDIQEFLFLNNEDIKWFHNLSTEWKAEIKQDEENKTFDIAKQISMNRMMIEHEERIYKKTGTTLLMITKILTDKSVKLSVSEKFFLYHKMAVTKRRMRDALEEKARLEENQDKLDWSFSPVRYLCGKIINYFF